jgi:hypothetical protein
MCRDPHLGEGGAAVLTCDLAVNWSWAAIFVNNARP